MIFQWQNFITGNVSPSELFTHVVFLLVQTQYTWEGWENQPSMTNSDNSLHTGSHNQLTISLNWLQINISIQIRQKCKSDPQAITNNLWLQMPTRDCQSHQSFLCKNILQSCVKLWIQQFSIMALPGLSTHTCSYKNSWQSNCEQHCLLS